MPLRFVLQEDNDPKHISRLLQEGFHDNDVRVMQWPAQLPYHNSIVNLWEEDENRVLLLNSQTSSLRLKINDVWMSLPIRTTQN